MGLHATEAKDSEHLRLDNFSLVEVGVAATQRSRGMAEHRRRFRSLAPICSYRERVCPLGCMHPMRKLQLWALGQGATSRRTTNPSTHCKLCFVFGRNQYADQKTMDNLDRMSDRVVLHASTLSLRRRRCERELKTPGNHVQVHTKRPT